MDFIVNREINFTFPAREFNISLRETEISRDVHYCSNSFHYTQWTSSRREIEDREKWSHAVKLCCYVIQNNRKLSWSGFGIKIAVNKDKQRFASEIE